jgi:hypothetical protein
LAEVPFKSGSIITTAVPLLVVAVICPELWAYAEDKPPTADIDAKMMARVM